MGPVQVSRRPLGLGHVYPRLPIPPVAGPGVDRRRRGYSPLPQGNRGRLRHRPADQLPLAGARRGLVRPSSPVDGDGRGHPDRRADHPDVRLPLPVLGLLPVRPGLRAVLAGPRGLRRPRGASAALARRSRPHRPAGRGHRQRRDRRHAGPGHRRGRGPRHHAAALAVVHHAVAHPRPGRRPAAQGAARTPGLCGRAVEERAGRDGPVPDVPQVPGADAGDAPPGGRQAPAGRVRRGQALQARLRTLGPAHVPGTRR